MTSTATDTPRRLTLADAYRDTQAALTAALTRTATEPSASVELTRNAKGDVQLSVKVYASANAEPDDVQRATAHAYEQATFAFEALRVEYPFTPPEPKGDAKKAGE